ncbi:MAG TPA: amidase [Acidobacteriaceae bacterium]|jgi:aspartyl-tRNA(Asn)/glutamyl-tRNA(Gln) amidotransferase subunit A|nr:amidase [Acidobacteriaceae bacterium]
MPSPLAALLAAYRAGTTSPEVEAGACLSRANRNAGRNTYIALDPDWTFAEARRQSARAEGALPLSGIPLALKDCFDLARFPTSSGSRFYARHLPPAAADSWVAARLRQAGAVITGKTHMHQLAFGITGENRDYGDCLQPANAALLTGGSSSGSAAAVQEGSALAAIGTDTGGSVRAPAALCGLAGYRSSLGVGDWSGGYHLSQSFDTIGWLFRDLRDAPRLAEALFDLPPEPQPSPATPSIGVLSGPLLEPCDAAVLRSMETWQDHLRRASARLEPIQPDFWSQAWDIYAPIQAAEAACLHAGHFDEFEPVIAARLSWGASLTEDELSQFRLRRHSFCEQSDALFRRFDFLLAPITPVSRLLAGADHSHTRPQILRLTTPASVAGLPAVVLPSPDCGVQLLARRNNDRRLLRFAARLGDQLAAEAAS